VYDNIVLLYGCFDKYLFQKERGKLDANIQKASELWISWLTYDCEKYSINLYNYCKNNPAIFTDRLGLFIEEEYTQYAVDFIAEIAESLKTMDAKWDYLTMIL